MRTVTKQPEMTPMVEIWRGQICESWHSGMAVVCNTKGEVIDGWGDLSHTILPRSSVKMIQALPLITSGAANAARLTQSQLAFACASHDGDPIHAQKARNWLDALGLTDDDLVCGAHVPTGKASRRAMQKAEQSPCRVHNNCSGKHCGFLTLNQHIGGDANYADPDHPVQKAALEAFELVTGETSPGFGIDGCSAPNFATSLQGLGRAMGFFAGAQEGGDSVSNAAYQLQTAMRAYPELVAGEERACTQLMRAAKGKVAIKTGAEGLFTAILPELGLGVALKISDGATRASECAIAALLVKLGALDENDPVVKKYLNPPINNFAGLYTGELKPAAGFPA